MRTNINVLYNLMFLSFLVSKSMGWASDNCDPYVRDACSVTKYQDLCIKSLASFSHTAKSSPRKWARAGVSVTLGESKNVLHFLNQLFNGSVMEGRDKIALGDCIENFQDTVDSLHMSLGVLRKLDPSDFDTQMGDLTTWVSAALTNEDTCLESYEEDANNNSDDKKQVKMIQRRVSRATYMTSNALALINKLATTGIDNLGL